MKTENTGAIGEKAVCGYLRRRFYIICAKNYKTRYGEIDIIAKTRKYLCFVEVKTRSESSYGTPAAAVTYAKQNKIIKTAQAYLKHNPTEKGIRFDIAEVYFNNGKTEINYIKDAFCLNENNS